MQIPCSSIFQRSPLPWSTVINKDVWLFVIMTYAWQGADPCVWSSQRKEVAWDQSILEFLGSLHFGIPAQ